MAEWVQRLRSYRSEAQPEAMESTNSDFPVPVLNGHKFKHHQLLLSDAVSTQKGENVLKAGKV